MCKFIALVALGMFIAGSALAHPPVKVNINPDGTGYACGSVVASQESGGSMDCWTVDGSVFCLVVEAGGERASCVSSNPDHVAAVRGMPDDACFLMAFDAEGECTDIITHTGTDVHPE